MSDKDLYQQITDRFIKAIEAGTEPWKCPWDKSCNSFLPVNSSLNEYHGINTMLLWMEQAEKGYQSNQWMTYKQASDLGGQVKKGEKGTQICFFKPLEIKDNNNTDEAQEIKKIPMLKTYSVFNREQIDNLPKNSEEITAVNDATFDPLEKAEQVLKDSEVEILEGGMKAFYMPASDVITLPSRSRFEANQAGAEAFYATALHELSHATKHKSRCDRKPYQTKIHNGSYSFEELVSELSAVYTMASLGFQGEKSNHESYVASWLSVLKNDKKAIFKAASQAQKACEWIKAQSSVFAKTTDEKHIIETPQTKNEFISASANAAELIEKLKQINPEINLNVQVASNNSTYKKGRGR